MLSVKIHQSTGSILLERASARNALNRKMIEELRQALDDLRQEKKVRGIVIAGNGAHFCAGLDVKELQEASQADDSMRLWFEYAQSIQGLIEQMLQCPKPLVAAVDGAAVGSGLALVLACDLVVASHKAIFKVPATKLGLVSGLVVPLLNFRAGASVASRMLLGLEELSAAEAKQLGLVHHVVDSEQVWVRASHKVEEISESAAEAVQLTKRVLNEMVGENLSTFLASGAAAMASAMTTEAAQEGMDAFAAKRKPSFP